MDVIYNSSDKHFEVFTTVFSPKVCRRSQHIGGYHGRGERVVAVLNYTPHWPDELELCQGDVIHILHKDDELWWFGRLHNGEQGYFPSNHVTKQNGINEDTSANLQSRCSLGRRVSFSSTEGYRAIKRRPSIFDKDESSESLRSSLKRSSVQEPAADVPAPSEGHCLKSPSCRKEGLFLAVGPEASLPLTESVSHSSPSLLQKILLKHKKKGPYQGATNSAFEPD
ncbi:vexin isoform X2 [Amia ocellicauda]|uniref:vexin isoform X2 n=1 Tax=Amia ocellicauda TaxID=2972642 RepID=UPI003464779E